MSRGLVATLAVLALAAGGTAVTVAAKTPSRPKAQVIKLVSRATPINNIVDTGVGGLSSGDIYVFSDKLFRANGEGNPVGSVDGTCTIVDPKGLRSVCTFAILLPRGGLTTAGTTSLAPGTLAVGSITGGTGAYARARGVGRVLLGTNEHKVTLTVYLD